MSILQMQLRVCLAAFLVAGLLLAGAASGASAATPCSEGKHHGTVASLAQLVQVADPDATSAGSAAGELGVCCSTAVNCCAGTAALLGEIVELEDSRVPTRWTQAAPSPLDGLGNEVNRHPPRLA